MKVLIITYYWYPAGGSGVQRWLYFVKYLRSFGVEPVIFTADKAKYPILDKSLATQIPDNVEIIKQKIIEFGGGKNQNSTGFLPEKPGLIQKFKNYIRANFFIPDARKLWIYPSAKKIEKYIKKNPVDFIITTGPPHSVHLIGKKVKEKTGVKWIADFRDPWTDIDYFHHLPLTRSSKEKHKLLEKSVLKSADKVIVVSKTMQEKYSMYNSECHVITNGFDTIDHEKPIELDKPFTLTHIGMLNADRNPKLLWKVLADMIYEDEIFEQDVQINLVGHIADEVRNSIRQYDLERFVNFTQYIPNTAVADFQRKSQVLLLIVNQVPSAKNIITGKVYEYLRAKRPILAIAPTDGDLAEILDQTQAGVVVDFDDYESLKDAIILYYNHYKKGNLTIESKNIEQYHRKNLTQQLVKLMN